MIEAGADMQPLQWHMPCIKRVLLDDQEKPKAEVVDVSLVCIRFRDAFCFFLSMCTHISLLFVCLTASASIWLQFVYI